MVGFNSLPSKKVSEIGLQGFEPWTSCTRGRRSTKLSHSPNFSRHVPAGFEPDGRAAQAISRTSRVLASDSSARRKSVDNVASARMIEIRLPATMLASISTPSVLTNGSPTILQFPSEPSRSVRSLRNMTAQLLQDAAKVIPNQQLLINVVSRRVRQLGIGHRPLVEATPKSSLTDIALKEIVAGKLTYEELKDEAGAEGK